MDVEVEFALAGMLFIYAVLVALCWPLFSKDDDIDRG